MSAQRGMFRAVGLDALEAEVVEIERRVRSLNRPLTPDERRSVTERVARVRERVADHYARHLMDNRPEVVSRGRPVAARAAKQGQDEARRRLRGQRQYRECSSDCPAATAYKTDRGLTVRCGVERTRLSEASDPQSLLTFCLGDYRACPTWRAERQRFLDGAPPLVLPSEGD